MGAYTEAENGTVTRNSDGAVIPPDPENRDYGEYLAYVEGGGGADPEPEPDKSDRFGAVSEAQTVVPLE